uniref:S100/CaBP-9k-type calcium binding subdomain domain-containing protein n=1 Tax=Oreochromis aureus TaxID=47969 RepID=A0AAZ1X9I3_OREAU
MKSAIIFLVFTLVLFMADPAELQPLQPQGNQVSGEVVQKVLKELIQSVAKPGPKDVNFNEFEDAVMS